MPKDDFDIIIIGSGSAGLSAAAELANSALKVAVLDVKGGEIGDWFDVKGTGFWIMQELGLEESIISRQSHFGMYSKNNAHTFSTTDPVSTCVINHNKLLKLLKNRTKCEFIKATVMDIKVTKDLVFITDFKGNKYTSRLLIDCSGNAFVGASCLGIKRPQVLYHCISAILRNCNMNNEKSDEMSLYMDMEICNSAFWFYPIDKSTCQIGIGDMAPYKVSASAELKRNLMRGMLLPQYKELFATAEIDESTIVIDYGPVIQPMEYMQADRIMFAGDCAGMATPLVGEGMRPTLIGGRNVGIVAKKAFSLNDFSKDVLQEHEKMWWERFGKYYIWTIIMRHVVCNHFDYKDWDNVIERLKKLSNDELTEVMTSRMTAKLLQNILDTGTLVDIFSDDFLKFVPHLNVFNKRHDTATFI